MESFRIAVIGGGGTGAAILHDLALRGFRAILFERGELTSGTTGRHHGQLHSGARYAVGDREIARECMEETRILNRIVPEAIEFNQGLFLAPDDAGEAYLPRFLEACAEAGIPAASLSRAQALAMEPGVNPESRAFVLVPDGTIDAFRLPLSFFATAVQNGAEVRRFSEVREVITEGGAVTGLRVFDRVAGREYREKADLVVNAGGAWSGRIAATAGVDVPVTPASGTMVAVRGRLTNMVISRLGPPGDGDIVVPQRGLSVVGTTQWTGADVEVSAPREADIPLLLRCGTELVPAMRGAPRYAAWSAVRPLAGRSPGEGRELSRDFTCMDHRSEGADGLVTILGGKATVLRAMAETTADLVCRKLGLDRPCRTKEVRLVSYRAFYGR